MKKRYVVAGSVIGLAIAMPIAAKHTIEHMAANAAARFAAPAAALDGPQARALKIAAMVHAIYRNSAGDDDQPLLFRLRPYLSNALLPDFIRVEEGAIEALLVEGICDSAARTTVYLLNSVGIQAQQINIIGRNGEAHSIVQAFEADGRAFLLDPLYGVAPIQDGRVLGAEQAQEVLRSGVAPDRLWQPIAEDGQYHAIYDRFADVWLSPQGAPFTWRVTIDLGSEDTLQVGQADGRFDDVEHDGASSGLTVYWSYLGHRYDRGWTRSLQVAQPTRVSIYLTEDVREGVITTDTPPDEVQGNMVRYDLDAGQHLNFRDDAASRDWLSLRSYQDVDYIVFSRL